MSGLFEATDYKTYLKQYFRADTNGPRLTQTAFGQAIGCNSAYVSHVLNGKAHLNLEQADRANRALGHSEEESEFFLLMVQVERAGTEELREYFVRQQRAILEKRSSLKNRLKAPLSVTENREGIYYSSWIYSAIHMSLTIEKLQRHDALAAHLGLPEEVILNGLDWLAKCGLARKQGNKWLPVEGHFHLEANSPHVVQHHANWRLRAIQEITLRPREGIHYSATFTVSRKDYLRIKETLADCLKQCVTTIGKSRDEEVCALTLDLFNLQT